MDDRDDNPAARKRLAKTIGELGSPDEWDSDDLASLIGRFPINITKSGAGPVVVTLNVAVLPPPQELSEYEKTSPGAAEHIFRAADEQRKHRHAIEAKLVDGDETRRSRGQLLSGGLSLIGLVGAIALGIVGNSWIAAILAIISIGGPLAAQRLTTMFPAVEGGELRQPSKKPSRGTSDVAEAP